MKMSQRELDQRLAALPRRLDPDPAVWRGVERRIARRRWRLPAALAASMVAGVLLVLSIQSVPGPSRTPLVASVTRAEMDAMSAVAPAFQTFSVLDAPRSLTRAWRENNAAIAELERALARDPENRLLLDFLARARLRQARLLQSAMTSTHQRSIEL